MASEPDTKEKQPPTGTSVMQFDVKATSAAIAVITKLNDTHSSFSERVVAFC